MMSSWGLLAFLKAADTRQGASIAVKDDSEDNDELFIEDYIAMADEEASEQRLVQAQRARGPQSQPQQGRPRNPNLRQGDVEITDFSQLEDDDL